MGYRMRRESYRVVGVFGGENFLADSTANRKRESRRSLGGRIRKGQQHQFGLHHQTPPPHIKMRPISQTILLLLALCFSVSAQFQFFEQMFGGGQQHQEPQNMPSDSSWYRENYANGNDRIPMK